jgi:hypothetical protein
MNSLSKFTGFAFLLLFTYCLPAGVIVDVKFEEVPSNLQLYTRDENDSAKVPFVGVVPVQGYDAIDIALYKNGDMLKSISQQLIYTNDVAPFNLAPVIHAELSEYKFVVELLSGDIRTHIVTVDSVVCGDAYILSGQSNSHYVWEDAVFTNEFCRTFGVKTGMSNYVAYQEEDTLWSMSQSTSAVGPNVGVLGLYIQKLLLDKHQIPTCIINGGTGGSIISEHLPDEIDRQNLTTIYGKLLYRVTKAKLDRFKGIIWHQGENDSDSQNTLQYVDRFRLLYDAWKLDYNAEQIYVFQIRPGCGGDTQGKFREIQRNLPELINATDISLMSTAAIPGHDGCHYSHSGYQIMANWIYNLIGIDFYGSTDTLEVIPPNIREAKYVPERKEIHLLFENTQSLSWPDDTLGQRLEDYFYLDGYFGLIESGYAHTDSVIIKLNGYQYIDKITYLPDVKDNSGLKTYEGPWLTNSKGIGAFSFYEFDIDNPEEMVKVIAPNGGEIWNPNTQQSIEWQSNAVSEVNIEFSSDNGLSWSLIAEKLPASGNYLWTIPEITSAECRVRLTDSNNKLIADESNQVFGVFSKTLILEYPNGGEKLSVDSTYSIRWQSEFIDNVRIQYSTDNGETWGTVKRIIAADPGQVDWVIPDNVSDSCRIKIIDADDAVIFDVSSEVFSIRSIAGIPYGNSQIPDEFGLKQNWPNPFNPSTTIEYSLKKSGRVKIDIWNSTGEIVKTMVNKNMNPGSYQVMWSGENNAGIPVASGIYYYVLYTGNEVVSKKMLLIR